MNGEIRKKELGWEMSIERKRETIILCFEIWKPQKVPKI